MIKQECIGIPDMILLLMIFCFKKIKIKAEIVLSPGGAYFWKWKSNLLSAFEKMKLLHQTSSIKFQQISWSVTLIFGVTFSAKVSSREQVFYGTFYHKHYKIRKNQLKI